jgi:hypothetical protein
MSVLEYLHLYMHLYISIYSCICVGTFTSGIYISIHKFISICICMRIGLLKRPFTSGIEDMIKNLGAGAAASDKSSVDSSSSSDNDRYISICMYVCMYS